VTLHKLVGGIAEPLVCGPQKLEIVQIEFLQHVRILVSRSAKEGYNHRNKNKKKKKKKKKNSTIESTAHYNENQETDPLLLLACQQ